MKHKFSLIWRVAVTLVLVLSFSLVAATPVSAVHTSSATVAFATGQSTIAGATGVILDVAVTSVSGSVDNIKTVKIDFSSSDFTVTGTGTVPTGWTGSGPTDDVVTYTHATGFAADNSKTFSPVVTNPETAGVATKPVVKTTDVVANVAATLPSTALTGWIGYTAKTAGTYGNDIDIIYDAQTSAYLPLVVAVSDSTIITVSLKTLADANVGVSTASEVADAIQADDDPGGAATLVDAVVAVGKDDETVPDLSTNNDLEGGITATADYNATVTGTLTVIAVPDVVWVDDDGSDANSGSSADDAVATIAQGISIAPAYGTVNVEPGTYAQGSTMLLINKAGLTLKSTGGAAVTTITSTVTGEPTIDLHASDVTFDGFTLKDLTTNQWSIWINPETDGVTVKNNIFTGKAAAECDHAAITLQGQENIAKEGLADAIISGNVISGFKFGIVILQGAKNNTISGNTITGCNTADVGAIWLAGGKTGLPTQGNTITGNTTTGNDGYGIDIKKYDTHGTFLSNNLISGNTISGNAQSGINVAADLTITGLTITENDITNNGVQGINILTATSWGGTNAINNNNIYGNTAGGLSSAADDIDAENNWWGDATGPYHATTNAGGEGDVVSDHVDYRPWLTAEYGAEEVTTIDLEVGWNLISVPKRMAAATDTFGELLTGITTGTSYSYDPVGGWSQLTNATPVEVLEGYWIDATAAGTITLSYKELGQAVPASKSLTGDAWNAIGFSSTTALDADTALMSIEGSWSTLIAWDAEGQAYEDAIIATGAGDMSPGKGYWIWMTEADVLSAISG